ncbi:MAG TPA: DUF5615 family PIN-like protein [Bryobacteraceae bacterium]|nr:DUF5615 family PIN-like protein [Bryobacteraceae bacterium]
MTFIADENIDRVIVQELRRIGHSVEHIGEFHAGMSDEEVLSLSRQRQAVLITADKDFGQLVFLHGQAYSGVMFLRLPGIAPEEKLRIVADVIAIYGSQLFGGFAVVTQSSVRLRKILPN